MSQAQAITGCRPGDIAKFAFLCGDPARVERIASGWKDVRWVCRVREYTIATGWLDGVEMTAASTGIGAPSTAIVVEELAHLGARTFIRIGNSGGLAPALELGDLVVTTAAIRDDGTSRSYVVPEFPAASHFEVTQALVSAAERTPARCHSGITWSFDAFYARNASVDAEGQYRSMGYGNYWPSHLEARIRDIQATGALNCEMESGVLLTLAGLFGLRAGCICVVSDRTPWPGPASIDLDRNMDQCIEVAGAAMLDLASKSATD